MTVTIDKQVRIIIDGEDVETLKDICEFARRWAAGHRHEFKGEMWVSEHDQREATRIQSLMDWIFDA